MTTIAFDSEWLPTEVNSESANVFITRTDQGHVKIHTETQTASPYAFGAYIPESAEAFAQIAELLKPVEDMEHFKTAWSEFSKTIIHNDAAEYVLNETPHKGRLTDSEINTFAKLYVACFPTLIQVFSTDYFLYDGFYGYSFPNGQYRPFYSALTYREMVETAAGIWQKDIAREFKKLDLYQAQLASDFSKFIHPNRLAEIMHDSGGKRAVEIYYNDFEGLEVLPMSVRERLAIQTLSGRVVSRPGVDQQATDDYELDAEIEGQDELAEIADSLDMIRFVGKNKLFKGSKSWRDVHDRAMRLAPNVDSDKAVKMPSHFKKLSELSDLDTKFVPLITPGEFVSLGEELNICIGKASYFFKSLRNESYCFKVIEDSETVGALEIASNAERTGWKIVQLRGRANSRLPNHDTVSKNILTVLNS